MKVDFSVYNNQKCISNAVLCASKPVIPAQYKEINEFSHAYYVPFTAFLKPVPIKSLENLKNIHCPSCGVKMLTNKGFQELVSNAENITTKEEFLRFLNVNFDYIDESIQNLIKILNKTAKDKPNISLTELLLKTQKSIEKSFDNVVKKQITKMSNPQGIEFTDFDKQILKEGAERMARVHYGSEEGITNSAHKDILKHTFSKIENPNKWDIYQNFRNEFTKLYEKKVMLSYSLSNNRDIPSVIAENIFRRSVSQVNKLNENIPQESYHNAILFCYNCTKYRPQALTNLTTAGSETELLRYNQYLEDVSQKILNGETDIEPSYIMSLNNSMKRLSKGNLYIQITPSMTKLKTESFAKRFKSIKFDLTEKEGIPCACCGKDTLTHSKKLELFDKINNAQNKRELVKILEDNSNVINENIQPLAEKIIEIVRKTPDIKDSEIMARLRKFSFEQARLKLEDNKDYVNKIIKHVPLSVSDRNYAFEYLKRIDNEFLTLSPDERFPWYDYGDTVQQTIGRMKTADVIKYYGYLKRNIRKLLSVEYAIYPLNPISEKFDSPLKVVIQNILKESVATKDHLVAQTKNGVDDSKNLIVLCKSCNRDKGKSGFFNWLKRDDKIQKNFEKYFRIINQKIKNGELEAKYKEYLKELQMNIYEISKGDFDINYLHDL